MKRQFFGSAWLAVFLTIATVISLTGCNDYLKGAEGVGKNGKATGARLADYVKSAKTANEETCVYSTMYAFVLFADSQDRSKSSADNPESLTKLLIEKSDECTNNNNYKLVMADLDALLEVGNGLSEAYGNIEALTSDKPKEEVLKSVEGLRSSLKDAYAKAGSDEVKTGIDVAANLVISAVRYGTIQAFAKNMGGVPDATATIIEKKAHSLDGIFEVHSKVKADAYKELNKHGYMDTKAHIDEYFKKYGIVLGEKATSSSFANSYLNYVINKDISGKPRDMQKEREAIIAKLKTLSADTRNLIADEAQVVAGQ